MVFELEDERIEIAHVSACAGLLRTTSRRALQAALGGWRHRTVQSGRERPGAVFELDRLHLLIDVRRSFDVKARTLWSYAPSR